MRRVVVKLLLAACIVSAIPFYGCAGATAADACGQFLERINSGEYAAAYEMLHSSVRYDEAQRASDESEGRQQPGERISREQFVARYENIFDALKIEGFAFTLSVSVEGEAICVYDYLLTYESEWMGGESIRFRMSVRRENGLWKIEWAPNLIFPEMQWGDTIRVGSVTARRGEILAGGIVYAQTVDAVSVVAIPEKITDISQFARQVSTLVDVSAAKIENQLIDTKNDFVILKQFYPDAFSETLQAQLLLIPGVSIDKSNFGTLRDYPQKDVLAHVIGYVGPVSADELRELTGSEEGDARYNADSRVGKLGLEKVYERQLRGVDGYFIYIHTADGQNRKTLYREPAQDGLDLQLTLDSDLQDRADKLLKYSLYGDHTSGAMIVLNPVTGAIKAMSSYPSYDLNLFARGMSEASYQAIANRANRPLFNRLTQGRYPPGSIFKPFTAAAALESGAMTPETTFPEGHGETIVDDVRWLPSDNGKFGPWRYAVITRVHLNNRHSPPLNMRSGMIDSDNIYFAYAALCTGAEYFAQFTEKLGINEAIPFDIPVSTAQLLNPDRESGEDEDNELNPMRLAESAFGQGQILVTPLQAAYLFGSLANGGNIMMPRLVEGLYRTEGVHYVLEEKIESAVWKSNVVQQSSLQIIEPMLEEVISMGTGSRLRLNNIAGKTGTAQIGNDRTREIVWFVGYRLRTDDPRLVLVMLEIPANDTELSTLRFEIARALLQ